MKILDERALSFWCNAYRAGVRITHNGGGFVLEAVDWQRTTNTKTFGLFAPVALDRSEVSAPILAGMDAHATGLCSLLTQPVPPKLLAWWYHPLALAYEGRPLAQMAAALGVAVWLVPCSLGVWPVVVSDAKADDGKFKMPELTPILASGGYSFCRDMYRKV